MELNNKKILITGGNSFLGKSLIPLLKKKGAKPITFSSKEYDLRKEKDVEKLFDLSNPEIVIHLAVDCGGLNYKKNNPGSIFYNNIMMDTLIQEYSRKYGVEKFVGIGSSASYPEFAKSPLKEQDLWEGCPEDFNYSYGLTKRMMLLQSQTYREQYGFSAIHLIPVNLYGPNFSMDSKNIRIIPILLKKFVEAKAENKKEIKIIGTKDASREFLYVEDCANAIILATESYNKSIPINLGYGKDITIEKLAEKVKEVVEYAGKIIWKDESFNKDPTRILDTSQAEKEFGFKAKTHLKEGLKKTLDWYLENYKNI